MVTRLYDCLFFRHSRADNAVVNGGIGQKFELIQAFINCKNDEDSIKNEGARVAITYLQFLSLWGFFQTLKGS